MHPHVILTLVLHKGAFGHIPKLDGLPQYRSSSQCTGAAPAPSASSEGGSRKRHDERPRDDAAKLGPYEGLQLVEETRSGRLLHHLGARVREHQVSVVRCAVRLVPVVPTDGNRVETAICVQHCTDRWINASTRRGRGSSVSLSIPLV